LFSRNTTKDWGEFWTNVEQAAKSNDKAKVAAVNSNLWDRLSKSRVSMEPSKLATAAINSNLWDRLSKSRVSMDPSKLATAESGQALLSAPDSDDGAMNAGGSSLSATELITRVSKQNDYLAELERTTSYVGRWVSALKYCLGVRDDNDFEKLLDEQWKNECD